MFKLGISLSAFVLALGLPAAYAVAGKPGPRTIEQTILRTMNSGPDGKITRRVDCARTSRTRPTFACELTSVRSTSLHVDVAVVDGGLRATWYPLKG